MHTMLEIYIPPEYHGVERVMRPIFTFGLKVRGTIGEGKVVWAVADGTAEHFDKLGYVWDYRDYDWSEADVLCFGADEESLLDSGKIKDDHDLVTIPNTSLSLHVDQAIAILVSHYTQNYPDADRDAFVKSRWDELCERRRKNKEAQGKT